MKNLASLGVTNKFTSLARKVAFLCFSVVFYAFLWPGFIYWHLNGSKHRNQGFADGLANVFSGVIISLFTWLFLGFLFFWLF